VLLPYTGPDDIAPLAEAVQGLRRDHPHALKIVLRELGGKMRYTHELALLRLGANAVVYHEVGFSRLLQTLAELRGQLYARPAGADVDGTLDAIAPDPVRGYRPVAAFCRSVQRMLERTSAVALDHCLVELPLLPHTAHLDALLACRIGRDGDIVTADARGLTLFLFGCREPDVGVTLQRLFRVPPSELFSHVAVSTSAAAMRSVLQALQRRAADEVTDYSAVLQAAQATRPPTPSAAALQRAVPFHALPRFTESAPGDLDALTAPADEPAPAAALSAGLTAAAVPAAAQRRGLQPAPLLLRPEA
jgi:hypothetical protein